MTRGTLTVGGKALAQGDGAAISDEATVSLVGETDAEALLFDVRSASSGHGRRDAD